MKKKLSLICALQLSYGIKKLSSILATTKPGLRKWDISVWYVKHDVKR